MKPTVLIVDDEADIRKSLQMILEYEDYQCISAATPQEGLELARKEDPDVILLDIKMPQMDGLEVLGRLKERGDRDGPHQRHRFDHRGERHREGAGGLASL